MAQFGIKYYKHESPVAVLNAIQVSDDKHLLFSVWLSDSKTSDNRDSDQVD